MQLPDLKPGSAGAAPRTADGFQATDGSLHRRSRACGSMGSPKGTAQPAAPQRCGSSQPSPQRCGSSPPGQTRSCRTWHFHPAVRPPTECTRRAAAGCGVTPCKSWVGVQCALQQRQGASDSNHGCQPEPLWLNCEGTKLSSHLEALLLQAVGNGGQLLLHSNTCKQHIALVRARGNERR